MDTKKHLLARLKRLRSLPGFPPLDGVAEVDVEVPSDSFERVAHCFEQVFGPPIYRQALPAQAIPSAYYYKTKAGCIIMLEPCARQRSGTVRCCVIPKQGDIYFHHMALSFR